MHCNFQDFSEGMIIRQMKAASVQFLLLLQEFISELQERVALFMKQ